MAQGISFMVSGVAFQFQFYYNIPIEQTRDKTIPSTVYRLLRLRPSVVFSPERSLTLTLNAVAT